MPPRFWKQTDNSLTQRQREMLLKDLQIRGIRYDEIYKKENKNWISHHRWVGLQGHCEAFLLPDWGYYNFGYEMIEEAKKRIPPFHKTKHEAAIRKRRQRKRGEQVETEEEEERRHLHEQVDKLNQTGRHDHCYWTLIPLGSTRSDDPPTHLRLKENVYFQGMNDHCLLGSIFNAVAFKMGEQQAKEIPITEADWFNQNWKQLLKEVVEKALDGYEVKKIKRKRNVKWTAEYVLNMNDRNIIMVQVEGKDLSCNHAICICDGYIFDAASKWVLRKNLEALNWCAGRHGFKTAMYLCQISKKIS